AAEVGLAGLAVHVVLDGGAVPQHRDLRAVAPAAHHHHPVDGLAAGQELRLGDDRRAPAAQLAALAPALLLGLQAGGAAHALHAVRRDVLGGGPAGAGRADAHDGVRRVVGLRLGRVVVVPAAPAAPAAAARAGAALLLLLLGLLLLRLAVVVGVVVVVGLVALTGLAAPAPAAPAAAAPAAGPLLLVGAVGVGVVLVLAGLRDDLLVRGGLRLGFRLRLRLDRPYGLRLRRVGRLEQRREDGRRALEHGAAGFVVAAGVQAERVGQQVDLEVVLVEVLPGGLVVERLVLGQHLDDLVLFVGLGHLVRFGLRRGLRPRNS